MYIYSILEHNIIHKYIYKLYLIDSDTTFMNFI